MACDPAELHRIVRDPWKRPEVLRACFYFVGSDLCLGWDTVHPTTVTSFALKLVAEPTRLPAGSGEKIYFDLELLLVARVLRSRALEVELVRFWDESQCTSH